MTPTPLRLTEFDAAGTLVRLGEFATARPPSGAPFIGRVVRIESTAAGVEVSLVVLFRLNGAAHPKRGSSRVLFADRVSGADQERCRRLAHA